MTPHYVYLAWSSAVKVGLTRKGRERQRWIDQGATRAVLCAELPTRKAAGELEMEIARFLPDRTDWRKMLSEAAEPDDLVRIKAQLASKLQGSSRFRGYWIHEDNTVHQFVYPRLQGASVNLDALSLDKSPHIDSVLLGIKGQYLLLAHGVFHVQRHQGYRVRVAFGD